MSAEQPLRLYKCLLSADIALNPHQVNAFCAAIQALKTGGIILADEVGLGKTIEAGLVLNYVLASGAKKVLISLPATLRKQWEVELLEKFGIHAIILDRYMADRFEFASVRQKVIEMIKTDLLGPVEENEVLHENPRFEYLVGMLAPQMDGNDGAGFEQEVEGDVAYEADADYTAGEEDDNEPISANRFKTPTSIGISFYIESITAELCVDVSWGDYVKKTEDVPDKDGKSRSSSSVWEAIGYVSDKPIVEGEEVTLYRTKETSPEYSA